MDEKIKIKLEINNKTEWLTYELDDIIIIEVNGKIVFQNVPE